MGVDDMRDLEKKLNYTFRNQALLEEALNHSSYANEHRAAGTTRRLCRSWSSARRIRCSPTT